MGGAGDWVGFRIPLAVLSGQELHDIEKDPCPGSPKPREGEMGGEDGGGGAALLLWMPQMGASPPPARHGPSPPELAVLWALPSPVPAWVAWNQAPGTFLLLNRGHRASPLPSTQITPGV